MTPSVSVVVPAFNAETFLAEALQSIAAQGMRCETILVDDGSSDRTAGIAGGFPGVRLLRHQANRGIAAARNSGVGAATGEFLAFLDADDIWPEDSLNARLTVLERDRTCEAVIGQAVQFGAGIPDYEPVAGAVAGGMLIRRTAFERVGRFDESLAIGEFIDWYARASELGITFREIPDVVLRRRIHAGNTTRRAASVEYTRVLRAALHRRREGS